MLHIILMILKILGILILSILGLGLCIGLLILFCPIRYYLEGSIYGKPEGKIRISWLFRFICATVSYKENRAECKISILGIRLKKRKKKETEDDSESIEEEKKKFHFFKRRKKEQGIEEKKAEKESEQTAKETDKNQEVSKAQQTEANEKEEIKIQQIEAEEREKTKVQQAETDKKEEVKTQQVEVDKKEEVKIDQIESERRIEKVVQKEEANKEESGEATNILESSKKDNEKKEIVQRESGRKKTQQFLESIITKIKESFIKIKNILMKVKSIPAKIKSILMKIKSIPAKIKGILIKIKDTLSALKASIQKFLMLLCDLNKKKQVILAFIRDEKNKEAFRYTRGKFFRLLCHILPGKVTLKLHYGFEDPAATGMLTGMIFMFYPKSAEQFQLIPDFENRVLEGELTIKGRVRLIRVLWILFSIYFHKECNRIIKMALKKLKMR